ncbi:MAG: hypothetical protein QM570_11210 [Planctomycetota bacterium]|nr:hypothetical protein [Planctomycetota bacterium]
MRMSQISMLHDRSVRSAASLVGATVLFCASMACCGIKKFEGELPTLRCDIPALAVENRGPLQERLIAAYVQDYVLRMIANNGRRLNDGMTIYYLQRELQSLIDMWRGTGNRAYLDIATSLTLQAIDEATASPMPLIRYGNTRGDWPCFYLAKVAAETGGHNQLCDFQGSAGFLLVARALYDIDDPNWRPIADFVERDVIEKWLYYQPSVTPEQLAGPNSFRTLLPLLNSGRDSREHFACLCLDLDGLGYDTYSYRMWAERLIELYLTPRYDPNETAPNSDEMGNTIPSDWGLFVRIADEGDLWLLIPDYGSGTADVPLDTSHANRTAWLACRAYAEGLIDETVLDGLINTLKLRIWAPEKGPFHFNNYTDGTDGMLGALQSGRGGNVWFGWHRLAAYDPDLETLFLALAYDLTHGGPNLPDGAQNKTMQNAPLCLEAWGTRLLGSKGQPDRFP